MQWFTALILATVPTQVPAQSQPAAPEKPDQKPDFRVQAHPYDLRAHDDENMRYLLNAPRDLKQSPDGGYKLVLVLPGGDGGLGFQAFVTDFAKLSMPEGYIVAQLVAPKWSDQQANQYVWPTLTSTTAEVKFTTEEFVNAVVDDVEKRCKVDPAHIFVFGWSSGGPAAYAASLDPKSKVTGAFVAMSVFKAGLLPYIDNAKGKSYYILHSPDDFIEMPYAESARDELAKAGATTKLETYEGGHGWHGDVFGMIRKGIEWLDQQASQPKSTDKPNDTH